MKIKNFTAYALLYKQTPTNPLLSSIDAAEKSLQEYGEKLQRDPTRTDASKELALNEAAASKIRTLLNEAIRQSEAASSEVKEYEKRAAEIMSIRGTTDMLILQNTAEALRDQNNLKVLELAEQEVDVARALLLLPTEKYRRKLTEGMKARLSDTITRNVLGSDYNTYKQKVALRDALNDMGEGLLSTLADRDHAVKKIRSLIAEAPAT